MVFECQQCGECCHHMAQVHIIQETRGEYRIPESITSIPGKKMWSGLMRRNIEFFSDKRIFLDHPEACPFLRYRDDERKAYCCVHLTRPEICGDYGCWRLLILNSRGKRAGRVMYPPYILFR